jgi:hypothetical protein
MRERVVPEEAIPLNTADSDIPAPREQVGGLRKLMSFKFMGALLLIASVAGCSESKKPASALRKAAKAVPAAVARKVAVEGIKYAAENKEEIASFIKGEPRAFSSKEQAEISKMAPKNTKLNLLQKLQVEIAFCNAQVRLLKGIQLRWKTVYADAESKISETSSYKELHEEECEQFSHEKQAAIVGIKRDNEYSQSSGHEFLKRKIVDHECDNIKNMPEVKPTPVEITGFRHPLYLPVKNGDKMAAFDLSEYKDATAEYIDIYENLIADYEKTAGQLKAKLEVKKKGVETPKLLDVKLLQEATDESVSRRVKLFEKPDLAKSEALIPTWQESYLEKLGGNSAVRIQKRRKRVQDELNETEQ